jgi:hypothetical protein
MIVRGEAAALIVNRAIARLHPPVAVAALTPRLRLQHCDPLAPRGLSVERVPEGAEGVKQRVDFARTHGFGPAL